MREVNHEEYKYLGVLQFDFIMNREIKKKVTREYIRRVKKLIRSQLNGGIVIAGINTWAVGIIGYEAGMLDWTKEESKSIDIKTRKLMPINGSLPPRANAGTLYLARKEEGRQIITFEECGMWKCRAWTSILARANNGC